MKRALLFATVIIYSFVALSPAAAGDPPNVLLIMTDDQGYGDLSCHGNPVLKTPNLDKLHSQSVRLTDFHVEPMCTPTRGQLMTGRDAMANGATAVCQGRSMVREGITTLPERFCRAGYATGMFGKWHLGDSYPYRPMDRGFDETVHHAAWGITSLADYWGNDYFDDVYRHNGRLEQYEGYCTDIWFAQAKRWMAAQKRQGKPFFCYLPTNVPHVPHIAPEKYIAPYRGSYQGKPLPAAFYGMIANLDENMGVLDSFLRENDLLDNTILIYLTDNGTASLQAAAVFNDGMRGHKTEVWEGGHRVPCFIRWPAGKIGPPRDIKQLTVVQDLTPTLVDLCSLERPAIADNSKLSRGISLAPLLTNDGSNVEAKLKQLDKRMKVVQYRIDGGYWSSAVVMWDRWRLLGRGDQLYDLSTDPHQDKNVAAAHPEIVKAMRDHYDAWYKEVKPQFDQVRRIHLGAAAQNPTMLYSQDWQGGYADNPGNLFQGTATGVWPVTVETPGEYQITLRRWSPESAAPLAGKNTTVDGRKVGTARPVTCARLIVGDFDQTIDCPTGSTKATFRATLAAGKTDLKTFLIGANGKVLCSAFYTEVELLGPDGKPVSPNPFTNVDLCVNPAPKTYKD